MGEWNTVSYVRYTLRNTQPTAHAWWLSVNVFDSSISTDKVCVYSDHIYCNYWQSLGFCNPRKSLYSTMAVKCKRTCGLCGGDFIKLPFTCMKCIVQYLGQRKPLLVVNCGGYFLLNSLFYVITKKLSIFHTRVILFEIR